MSEDANPTNPEPALAPPDAADATLGDTLAARYGFGIASEDAAPPSVAAPVTDDHRIIGKVFRHCVTTADGIAGRLELALAKKLGVAAEMVADAATTPDELDEIEELAAMVAAKRNWTAGSVPELALVVVMLRPIASHVMLAAQLRKAAAPTPQGGTVLPFVMPPNPAPSPVQPNAH